MTNTEKKVIPIFYAVDDNYISILHVALQSLTSQASKDSFLNVHILYENLNEANKKGLSVFNGKNCKITLDDITKVVAGRAKKMHARYYHSKAIYYRVFIPNMFPQYDKAIYLDTDTVLNSDITELFDYDVEDNYLAAVPCETVNNNPYFVAYAEKYLGVKVQQYFNSGVLLLNCDVLRKVNFEDKFFEILHLVKLEIAPDQDYFNILAYGNTVMLPKNWNKIPRPNSTEKLEEIKLVHYNLALKPWRYDKILYQELFWEHAKNTDHYKKIQASKNRILKFEVLKDNERTKALIRMAKNLAKVEEPVLFTLNNGKAPDRVAVLNKIAEYEKKGWFDREVEDNPPIVPINSDKFDFTNKKFSSRLKARFATYCGRKYFDKMIKRGEVVVGEVKGLENLQDFNKGAIVTCNHINQFDNYAVFLALKKAYPHLTLWRIVREGNFSFKGTVGLILRNANTLPISTTNTKLLKSCLRATKTLLERGEKILIYPEQSMWWNYKKPRPFKDGAFVFASRAHSAVIPCFITLRDTKKIGKNGFPIMEFTVNISPIIKYDEAKTEKENTAMMRERNAELWSKVYKETYGEDPTIETSTTPKPKTSPKS